MSCIQVSQHLSRVLQLKDASKLFQVDKIVLLRIHTLKGRQIEAKKALSRCLSFKETTLLITKFQFQLPNAKYMQQFQQSFLFREQLEQCGIQGRQSRGLKREGGEEHDSTGVKRTRGGKLIEPRDPEDPAMRKMFAGNLCNTTSQEQLKAFFSGFGEVESCYCAINKTTGKCKGYGFVTYKQAESVDAVQAGRPHTLLGREVDTRRAVPKELQGNPESELRSKKLYVTGMRGPKSGLNDDISDADLQEYFGQFGTVLNVSQKLHSAAAPQVDPSKIGKKTGFGYIEFDDEDPVDKLVLIGVIHFKGAVLEARRGLSREQQEEVKMKQQMQGAMAQHGGNQYGGNNGSMQGMMADMQSKMAGAGMGGMAGQMGKMSSMVASMDGAGGAALATSMNGMLKGMQGMMSTLGTSPELTASMSGMMVSMMELCQQMMMATSKQSKQQAAVPHGEQYDTGEWGGGYESVPAGYRRSGNPSYGNSSYSQSSSGGYGSSSQGAYPGSSYGGYPGGSYGGNPAGSHASGHGARPGNSSWAATRGKTEQKYGSSGGRADYSGHYFY